MATSLVNRAVARVLARRMARAYLLYANAQGPKLADSVTYRTLFSVFAAVLLGFSFATLWLAGNPDGLRSLVAAVNSAIPGLVGLEEGDGLIDVSTVAAPAGLTIAGVVATVGLLGAAIGAIGSLRSALRTIAGSSQRDVMIVWSLLRNLALATGMGAGLIAAAAVTFVATAGIGLLTDLLGLPSGSAGVAFAAWLVSTLVVFALDTAVVAVLFATLAGVNTRVRTLLSGAMLGGLGLTVLQQLSGLFVGGATSNPLLGTFAALIALLLWLNLSSQVILIASAVITIGAQEDVDRVSARYGASTMAQYQVRLAERGVQAATDVLAEARETEEKERNGSRPSETSPS